MKLFLSALLSLVAASLLLTRATAAPTIDLNATSELAKRDYGCPLSSRKCRLHVSEV